MRAGFRGSLLRLSSKSPLDLSQKLAAQEKEMIEAALRESGGRVFGPSGAAAKLGMARSTLESKIRSLKINKNRFKTANPLGRLLSPLLPSLNSVRTDILYGISPIGEQSANYMNVNPFIFMMVTVGAWIAKYRRRSTPREASMLRIQRSTNGEVVLTAERPITRGKFSTS